MSVTFMWEPIKDAHSFEEGTSSDQDAFAPAFGTLPIELGPEAVDKLMAMSYARGGDNIFKEVAEKIEKIGRIRIWTEH